MKAAPPLEMTILSDSRTSLRDVASKTAVTDFAYRQQPGVMANSSASVSSKALANLTTIRALGRQVFGVEAGREYIKEAIAFILLLGVAAWPLSITLDMLGTMMISPPAW